MIFDIYELLTRLNYEFIRCAHLKDGATCIIITIKNLHYNGLYFGILNNI